GLAAAALLATTPALFTHARVARPDVLLVLLLSLALGRAFRWWRDGERRDATAALAWLGAATFAKGPVAPVLFALTLGAFLAWQRELRRLPRLVTLPGLAAFAVLGLGWYAVALAGWGHEFVHAHLVGRYLRNLAGGLATGGAYSPKPLTYHLLFYVKHLPAVALPWTPFTALALSPSDRSTLDALLRIVPGGPSAAVAGVGFVAGLLLVALAWRAWPALLALVATATVLWMAAGQPALEAAISQRDSLKPFARAVAARYPPPAALAFWRDPIRAVAVYVGRPLPTYRRREELLPGLALVGSEPALRDLLRAGVVGFPTLSAEGRLGNVARGRVVLLEVAAGRATAVGSSRSPSSAAERASRRS